jgi:hypothetical protein
VLDAGGGLGAAVDEAAEVSDEEGARVGLREGVARGRQLVTLDGGARPRVDGAALGVVQARRARDGLADGDGFEARDVDVDEVRVGAADAGRRAGAAVLRAVLEVELDVCLEGGLAPLQARQRLRL